MKRIVGVANVVLLSVLVACGGGTPKASSSPTQSARISSPAKIIVESPAPNATVHGSVLTVKLKLLNAVIVPKTTLTISPTTGHIHVSIDGQLKAIYAGLNYQQPGLTPGRHLLTVEFVAADHGPFNPDVKVNVTFVVV
jgi:hypothetical protein